MTTKTVKIIYWVSTIFIFLFEGVMPALTGHSELAIQGITHLGYPVYFVSIIAIAKVLGSIVITIPQFPSKIKEWAYAGFVIELICAFISHWVVDGFNGQTIFPLFILAILILSYWSWNKLQTLNKPMTS